MTTYLGRIEATNPLTALYEQLTARQTGRREIAYQLALRFIDRTIYDAMSAGRGSRLGRAPPDASRGADLGLCAAVSDGGVAMTGRWSADAVVEDLVDACLEFTLVLLEKRMPDDRQFMRVKEALVRCGDAWEGLDSIPRLAVNALVDLQPTVLGAAEIVAGGERKLLLEWSYEIGDLVRAAVGVKGWPT